MSIIVNLKNAHNLSTVVTLSIIVNLKKLRGILANTQELGILMFALYSYIGVLKTQ